MLKGTASAVFAGGLSLTIPTEALAIAPTTLMAVGSAAFSIYRMSRQGGGGIADLLSAQTEMLRAISTEVAVINGKLDLVYSRLGEIEKAIHNLPVKVANQTFRGQILGALLECSKQIELAQTYEAQRGRPYAIDMLKASAPINLDHLVTPTSSILAEQNVANLPILTLAWFMELQMRARSLAYEREPIRVSARTYLHHAEPLISSLEGELRDLETKLLPLKSQLSREAFYPGYSCYDQINSKVTVASPMGGRFRYTVTGRLNSLSQSDPSLDPSTDPYLLGFSELSSAGIQLPKELSDPVGQWTVARQQATLLDQTVNGYGLPTDAYSNANRDAYEKSCGGPLGHPDNFIAKHGSLIDDLEELKVSALVNGHLLLVGRELKRSSEAVLARLPSS